MPPTLLENAPAAWPEGLEATAAEVVLELLLDEQGRVSEVKVTQAATEPRLTEAAVAAAPRLRFTAATLEGVPPRRRQGRHYLGRVRDEGVPQVEAGYWDRTEAQPVRANHRASCAARLNGCSLGRGERSANTQNMETA